MTYKDEILRLKDSGLTYDEIAEKLGCVKSTVCYHIDASQKEKTAKRKRDKRNNLRKMVSQIKSDAICADCKVNYPPHILQFDHLPERGEKVADITTLMMNSSKEAVLAEIRKCEIVCANCHWERTYQRALRTKESAGHYINGE